MKPFLALLKVTFRNYFGISVMKQKYLVEKKDLWQPIAAVVGIGFILVFFFSMSMMFSKGLYYVGQMLGEPALVLVISFITTAFIIFIFDIGTVISVFYFGRDNELLAALPLKPLYVLGARFSLVMFSQYLVQLVLILPPLFIFFQGEGLGAAYIFLASVIFLVFPVLPLVPAAVLSILIMSKARSKRIKDTFTILTYVISLAFAIGIQFFMQSLPQGEELSSLQAMLQTHGSLLSEVGSSFPPAIWAAKSLAMAGSIEGLLNLGLFLALTAALVALMLVLGNRYFYRGLFAGEEVAKKHRVTNSADSWSSSSPFKALLLREHRLFIRTPVFLMNVLPIAVIVPIFMLIPLFTQGSLQEINSLYPILSKYPYLKLGIIGFMIFIAGTIPLSPSALSREGKLFTLSQLIPVSPREQVKAKFWYTLIVNFVCTLPIFVLSIILLHLTWLDALMLGLLSLSAVGVITALGILIDSERPYFDWEDPQRAVKNNLNVLFIMLISMIFLAIMAGICVGLYLIVPWWLGYSLLLLLVTSISAVLYFRIQYIAERKYQHYEL